VLAIRERAPRTAADLLRAVNVLMQVGRPDEAKGYLQQLLAAALDAPALERLQRTFGSAFFVRLMSRADLAPEGAQFADAVLNAAWLAARDPDRLARLVQQLEDSSPARRRAAVVDLRAAGALGAAALIDALAKRAVQDPARVQAALVALGESAVEPLTAALAAEDVALRSAAMGVLGQLRSTAAIPFLLAPALASEEDSAAARAALERIAGALPGRAEAELYLERLVRESLERPTDEEAAAASIERTETLWRWDASTRSLVAESWDAATARWTRAARVAAELTRLDPTRAAYRRLQLAALLESQQAARAFDPSLSAAEQTGQAELAGASLSELEALLAFALDEQHHGAALATLDQLAARGGESLLAGQLGERRSMVRALESPSRRVRFAAAMRILELDPKSPYPGSSLLPETLASFVREGPGRRVLVAHARQDLAQDLVGLLGGLGFEVETATEGGRAYQLARESADYEFLLIADMIDRPPLAAIWQRLRHDPRTADLPVGILARPERLPEVQRLVEKDPLSHAFPHAIDQGAALQVVTRRMLAIGARWSVDGEGRGARAVAALERFAYLAARSEQYPFYDLLRYEPTIERALQRGPHSAAAAEVLGAFGTPSAQRALVELASQHAQPLSQREAAARAFAVAVQRRGLLLTSQEILRQYDRYNQSATQDRDTQRVLGALLDTIETPVRHPGSQSGAFPMD
jgi:CheY-like chemotaxis protein